MDFLACFGLRVTPVHLHHSVRRASASAVLAAAARFFSAHRAARVQPGYPQARATRARHLTSSVATLSRESLVVSSHLDMPVRPLRNAHRVSVTVQCVALEQYHTAVRVVLSLLVLPQACAHPARLRMFRLAPPRVASLVAFALLELHALSARTARMQTVRRIYASRLLRRIRRVVIHPAVSISVVCVI